MTDHGKDFEVLEETGFAAPTMVTDGQRVCAIFATGDMGCFDLDGRRLWTRGLGLPMNAYGHASSLAIWRDLVIVQFDQGDREDGKSKIMALAMDSGSFVWRKDRPVGNSWASPTVASIGGREAIITAADPWVIAYDPADGSELWRAECLGGDVASSPYYFDGKVFATKPFEKLVAIDVGGSGDITASHIAWTTENLGPEVCGLLSDGRQVLTLAGKGVLTAYNMLDGSRQWETELDADFYASPALVGDKLYLLSRKGTMFIVDIETPNTILSACELGEECCASPAFADGRIYVRAKQNLYCIGVSKKVQTQTRLETKRAVVGVHADGWVEGRLVRMDGVASDLRASWPSFRGPRHDGVAQDQEDLAGSWAEGGPPVKWSINVGQGHAGAAIHDGRVYLVDYDEAAKEDVIRCMSLDDGRDIWQYRYPVVIQPNHGITRAVPAVTDEFLVAIGPKGHVTCLHPRSGELKWTLDPVERFGGKIPQWYSGQCPLIDEGKLVLAVGGDSLLAAIDCRSGEFLWGSGNPHRWKMTHSSVMPIEFGGRRQYVYCASDGVVGVDVEDGEILWDFRDWRVRIACVPAPLVVGPGRIFLSGGYRAGGLMVQLRHEAGKFVAEQEFRLAEDVFSSQVHTPILFAGHIYGVRMDGQLVCLDLQGKVMWTSGANRRFGLGPYLIADGKIYVMDDKAVLTLVEATPSDYFECARAKLFDGSDAWGAAAMAAGRLILRDLRKMVCVDVTSPRETPLDEAQYPGSRAQSGMWRTQPKAQLTKESLTLTHRYAQWLFHGNPKRFLRHTMIPAVDNGQQLTHRPILALTMKLLTRVHPVALVVTVVIGLTSCSQPPPSIITPRVSVGKVRAGMTVQQVVAELGEPNLRSGPNLSYARFGFVVYTSKGVVGIVTCGDPEGIDGAFARRFNGRTGKGIGIGSTRAEVVHAYGEPTETGWQRPGHEILDYDPLGLTFTFEDDKVHLIFVDLRRK